MIVLDTHVWVWLVSDPKKLSRKAAAAIDRAVSEKIPIFVSSISVWEVAMLVSRGRLELSMDVRDWVTKSETVPFLTFAPVDNVIALRSVLLPEPFHGDPADRLIVATALTKGATLISGDKKILNYGAVKTTW